MIKAFLQVGLPEIGLQRDKKSDSRGYNRRPGSRKVLK